MNQPQRKLELKDISCYLPYGLIMESTYPQGKMIIDGLVGLKGMFGIAENGSWKPCQDYFKPYMRPLSSLTKHITHNGETFVPLERIKEKYNELNTDHISEVRFHCIGGFTLFGTDKYDYTSSPIPLWAYELCYEWMLDINDLLSDNLAIELID